MNVLQNVTTCLEEGVEYRGNEEVRHSRETRKIKCGSVEAELIAKWMEEGLGFRLTTMFLNDHLKQEGKKEVSVKSVYNAFYHMNPLITKIEKKPQRPENQKLWSEARYNWVAQLLVRTRSITTESLPEDMRTKRYFNSELLEREGKMFDWAQVAHFDEMHIEQIAGMVTTNGYQVRFRRDKDGKVVHDDKKEGTYGDVGVRALLKTFLFTLSCQLKEIFLLFCLNTDSPNI